MLYHSVYMKDQHLPKSINPYSMADRRVHLTGEFQVIDMPRLVSFLAGPEGLVEIDLQLDRDHRRLAFIKGCIKAELLILCQRCMQPFRYVVEKTLLLRPVLDDDQAKLVEPEYDPVMVEDQKLSLIEAVEDEIILCLPTVAMHEKSECPVTLPDDEVDTEIERGPSPFDVLANKKRD